MTPSLIITESYPSGALIRKVASLRFCLALKIDPKCAGGRQNSHQLILSSLWLSRSSLFCCGVASLQTWLPEARFVREGLWWRFCGERNMGKHLQRSWERPAWACAWLQQEWGVLKPSLITQFRSSPHQCPVLSVLKTKENVILVNAGLTCARQTFCHWATSTALPYYFLRIHRGKKKKEPKVLLDLSDV